MRKKNQPKSGRGSLEDSYDRMMTGFPRGLSEYSRWEKVGDFYKQFSLYDTSKYETTYVSAELA